MKIKISFKTPDTVDYAIKDNLYREPPEYETDEDREIREDKESDERYDIVKFINTYVRYGEAVTIEFNTDKQSVRVLKSNE